MKKNDVFTFTAPNGVEVTAVVIAQVEVIFDPETYYETIEDWIDLCYAQNRLFTYYRQAKKIREVLVDYAILPEYDSMLEEHQKDIDMKNASIIQPWEEEFERELQGCND